MLRLEVNFEGDSNNNGDIRLLQRCFAHMITGIIAVPGTDCGIIMKCRATVLSAEPHDTCDASGTEF